MKSRQSGGFSLIEWLIVVTLVAIIASFAIPWNSHVRYSHLQSKRISNAKQISIACIFFATDHAGRFPNGNYDPALGEVTDEIPAGSAEACFTDLLETKIIEVEKIFWGPIQPIQCQSGTPVRTPDENGILTPMENCWDYIAGLTNDSPPHLPLVFEASDNGDGTNWSELGGHPWEDRVIVSYTDGSAERFELNKSKQAKTERDGTEVHLCIPTPGKNGWPGTAKIAPATPAPKSSP